MRNYWLRIVFGALGIFAIGMLAWSGVQRGKHAVKRVVESDEPITIPLALIPFNVDGRSVGTLRQVQIIRSDPEKVKAVNFRVRLADSISDGRFDECVLVVGGSLENIDAQHAFSCATTADTTGGNLAPIGEVETQRGRNYVLFAKAGTLDSIKLDFIHQKGDSIREAQRAFADSIREAEQERADSIRETANERADSIRSAAESMSDSIRAHVDSVLRAGRPEPEPARGTRRPPRAGVTVAPPPPPATPRP
jgi:hypothetical protein